MIEFFLWHGLAMTAVIVISFVAGYTTKSMMLKRKHNR
mgnify:CR=1 FL=1